MLYSVNYILNDIIEHLEKKQPFSLVRIGDGDLKLLSALSKGRPNNIKFDRSGIPYNKVEWLLQLYRCSCNNANYISSFEVYKDQKLWHRNFSKGAKRIVDNWELIYEKSNIVNNSFCNPEIGHLLFLNSYNFFNRIKGRKIALITCFKQVYTYLLSQGIDGTIILIPPLNSNHYSRYNLILKEIKKVSKIVDIFFVGAGALGKGYLNYIKNLGSVSVDIGQVMNVWANKKLPGRYRGILTFDRQNMVFNFRKENEKYIEYL